MTERRRRPRRRIGEGGRRLHSAGSAIVVSLTGLLIALLLNAPGLHKSATIQPEGWKRDAALAVTGPLERASEALLLDRPRRALKAVLGRSEDDEIDVAVALPKPGAGGTPTAPPKRGRFSPKRKLGVWIAGDSLVVVPGESLLRAIADNRALTPAGKIDGRIASGLERPDVFNWFTHVRDQIRRKKPQAAVLMLGGNDDHGFMTGLPEGREVGSFGSPSWRAEYRRRVAAIMETVTGAGAFLVWIGLPISHDSGQTARYDVINSIVQSEAAKRPGRAFYLDTYFFFAGADGGFAEYIEDDAGKLVKMRADDGIHFERAAGDLIAKKVLERLEERYDITSWRKSS
ncbi:MAG: DUF459 domain-containing protein [Gaiellaceae bacterium]